MAKSQTFTAACSAVGGFGYASYFTLYVVLTDRDGNSSTNVSQVDYNVYCQSSGSGSINANHLKYFNLNGTEIINTTVKVNVSSPNAYISIASGTLTNVGHNSDGSKTISFSAQIKASSYGVSASASGSFELEKIPRYTTVTNSERGRTINTISVNWATTDARDHTQYSIKGGAWSNWSSWTDAYDTVAADNKSGYYTISGLSPNTTYTVKTRCKRTDSQLWSESTSNVTITTYDFAKITSAPDFTDEENPTINYSNPFGNNVATLKACISLTGAKDDIAYRDIPKTGTSYTFNLTDAERTVLRKASTITSLKVTFFIRTEYGSTYYSTVDKTMSIVNANPNFSNFTYIDTNTDKLVGKLTNANGQTIVKGYSNVKGIISVSNKATAKKEASMSKYRLSIGEKTAEVAYSSTSEVSTTISAVTSNTFTMYAIDSRGNSTPKSITANNYIAYTPIAITSIRLLRTNSVTSETTLKFSGTIWNGNFGLVDNAIVSCYYRYKSTLSNTWVTGATTITPTKSGSSFSFTGKIQGDLGADGFNIDNSYDIQVFIADKLSNNNNNPASFTLGPGTPGLAIYKNNVAVGQRYDTSDGSKFQVNGNEKIKGDSIITGTTKALNVNSYFSGVINPAHWYYIGLFEFNNQGAYAVIDCYMGEGQNGAAHQNTHAKILLKQGWTGDALPIGVTTQFTQNYSSLIKVKIKHVISTMCQLFIYLPFGYNDLTYIVNGSYNFFKPFNMALDYTPETDKESTYYAPYQYYAPVSLFDNSSGTTGTIQLSESAANFNYLEFFICDNNGNNHKSVRAYNPNGKNVSLGIDEGYLENNLVRTTFRTKRVSVSGTSVTIYNNSYSYLSFNENGYAYHTHENFIKITKIIGYR